MRNAMRLRCDWKLLFCAVALTASAALGQTTQPSTEAGMLQLRANEALAKQDYKSALAYLKKVEVDLQDRPDDPALGLVMEQMRVCERNLKNGTNPAPAPVVRQWVSALPPEIPMSAETRAVHPPPIPGETVALAIKELGNFEYDAEKGGNIPMDVTRLDGLHFRTQGYMIPIDQAESISEFALVPSLFACCFGQPPQVQHTIVVHCPKDKAMQYYPDELVVEGTLRVQENRDAGFIVSIFEIDATSVRPAPK
jgi:hypothetical protein